MAAAIRLSQQHSCSFDHLVGERDQLVWHVEAERLRGLEIDEQLELGRRLHRKLGRFFALEDAADVFGGSPVLVGAIDAIGYDPSGGDGLTERIDGRQSMPRRQRHDELAMQRGARIREHTSKPPFGARANSSMPRSMSDASPNATRTSSIESDCAAVSIEGKYCPV